MEPGRVLLSLVRKVLALGCCGLALSLGLVDLRAPASAEAAAVTRCVGPSFRGHDHRKHALRRTDLAVRERVGTVVFYRNYNSNCFREEEFVHRLRGIAVGRAVSFAGSRRELLIRGHICIRARSDMALVRCLKRGA
jgi:hypothetical protein